MQTGVEPRFPAPAGPRAGTPDVVPCLSRAESGPRCTPAGIGNRATGEAAAARPGGRDQSRCQRPGVGVEVGVGASSRLQEKLPEYQ